MLISAPTCIGISQTADLIVAVSLGPKWHEAAPFLQLLALAVLTVPYYQTLYSFGLAVDRPVVLFKLNVIDLGLRILFISAGLYFFSVIGVMVARGLISVVMFAFYLLYARGLAGVTLSAQLANLWKVAVASVAMAAAVLVLRHALAPLELNAFVELFSTAALGAVVYVSALYGCGVRLIIGRGRFELTDGWW
jgi:PST family polysaccharide transporter